MRHGSGILLPGTIPEQDCSKIWNMPASKTHLPVRQKSPRLLSLLPVHLRQKLPDPPVVPAGEEAGRCVPDETDRLVPGGEIASGQSMLPRPRPGAGTRSTPGPGWRGGLYRFSMSEPSRMLYRREQKEDDRARGVRGVQEPDICRGEVCGVKRDIQGI